jgi:alpha-tubulin suppressor-like RCC1 family protein
MSSVYIWGDNRRSQLGYPTKKNEKTIFEPKHLTTLDGQSITATAGGQSHSIYLTEFGEVFACGRNVEGQCGQTHRKDVLEPTLVCGPLSEHRVISICCSAFSSLAVTSSGRVYEFGLVHEQFQDSNDDETKQSGQRNQQQSQQQNGTRMTGLADAIDAVPHSEIVSRIIRKSELRYLQEGCEEGVQLDEGILSVKTKKIIVSVPRVVSSLNGIQIQLCAAGDGHIIVAARDGTMYSCGSNDRGQLGDGTRVNRASFVKVMPIEKHSMTEWYPSEIAIGQQHNVVLLKNRSNSRGVIFTWGSGALGQLGQGTSGRDCLRPRPVLYSLENENIVSVACGSNHSAAVTKIGQVYMWGHSEYGQLDPGHSGGRDRRHHGRYYYQPREFVIQSSPPIVSLSCTTHATVAIDVDGGVHAWGWNSHGVLGRGKGRVALGAQHIWKLKDKKVKHIGAGHSHVIALVESKEKSFDLAKQFNKLLNCAGSGSSALFADLCILWPGESKNNDNTLFLHRALLHARCPKFLEELLKQPFVLKGDGGGEEKQALTTATTTLESGAIFTQRPSSMSQVKFDAIHAFLEYIYKDEVDWRASHRGRRTLPNDVMWLSQTFQLPRLSSMCAVRLSKSSNTFGSGGLVVAGNRGALLREITRKATKFMFKKVDKRPTKKHRLNVTSEPMTTPPPVPTTLGSSMSETKTGTTAVNFEISKTDDVSTDVPMSTYQKEMSKLLHSARYFDIKLSSHGMKKANEEPVPCHRAILCRYSFFRALLSGNWKESSSEIVILGENMPKKSLVTVSSVYCIFFYIR